MKKQITVAIVRRPGDKDIRIPLLTTADACHLLALAMGYREDVAFAMGVISRSIPEAKDGTLDLTLEHAHKIARLADLISLTRATGVLPADNDTLTSLSVVTQHVHVVEDCYAELMAKDTSGDFKRELDSVYAEWLAAAEKKSKPSRFKRFLNYLIMRTPNEQSKHS